MHITRLKYDWWRVLPPPIDENFLSDEDIKVFVAVVVTTGTIATWQCLIFIVDTYSKIWHLDFWLSSEFCLKLFSKVTLSHWTKIALFPLPIIQQRWKKGISVSSWGIGLKSWQLGNNWSSLKNVASPHHLVTHFLSPKQSENQKQPLQRGWFDCKHMYCKHRKSVPTFSGSITKVAPLVIRSSTWHVMTTRSKGNITAIIVGPVMISKFEQCYWDTTKHLWGNTALTEPHSLSEKGIICHYNRVSWSVNKNFIMFLLPKYFDLSLYYLMIIY